MNEKNYRLSAVGESSGEAFSRFKHRVFVVTIGLLITACNEDLKKEEEALKSSIESNSESIALYESKISELQSSLEANKEVIKLHDEVVKKQEQVPALEADQERLNAALEDMRKAIESQQDAFAEYRQLYRDSERSLAVGEKVDLSSTHGDAFKDLEIRKVDAQFLHVMLPAGPKGIPFSELPESLQDRFQFSDDEADMLARARAKQRSAAGSALASAREMKRTEQSEQAERDEIAKIGILKGQVRMLNIQVKKYLSQAEEEDDEARRQDEKASWARRNDKVTAAPALATQARARAAKHRKSADATRSKAVALENEMRFLQRKYNIEPNDQ